MNPDFLFLTAGIVAAGLAVCSLRSRSLNNGRDRGLSVLLWLCLSAGLLIQAFAPHLRIEDNAFVVPEKTPSGIAITDPIQVVETERRMQLASATLCSISILGLFFLYRNHLPRPHGKAGGNMASERRECLPR